jgi:hypothetical protein
LVPWFDGGDDFVWVLGPGNGLWICVGVIEEAVDGFLKFVEGSEHAALETLLCELGEEALDGIEPGSGCWGEVEDKPRMFFEPLDDVGMLVGGIVVDDDMDHLLFGHSGLDDAQKSCVNMNAADGSASSFYINAAHAIVVEANYCR